MSRPNVKIESFAKDTSGNVVMMFAVMMLAIVSVIGLAVDFQRGVSAEQTVQHALDATVLSASKAAQDASLSDAALTTKAQDFFAANLTAENPALVCPKPVISIDRAAGLVEASANCKLPTTLAAIFSVNEVSVSRSATATLQITKLDLALMLDVSGSMKGQKLEDLKAAAKNAVDILITPSTGDRVRISFDSYSTAINVGDYAKAVKGSNYNAGSSTAKCVTERSGIAKFRDDAPAFGKYMEEEPVATNNVNLWCPASSLAPLTSNASALKSSIGTLTASGNTAGHLGVAWAWYLISPDWGKIWPSASKPLGYNDDNTVKAVILMTDGAFNTYYEDTQGNSVRQSKRLCANMKSKGVIVYSVAFQAPSGGKDVLQTCASSADHFFDAANGEELKDAYAAIASQLTNLRLKH